MTVDRADIPTSRGYCVIGHEVFYSETNNRHLIAVCSCGWIGTPTTWRTDWDERTKRAAVNKELTIDVVTREHVEHCATVAADVEARSERVLDANAKAVAKLIPTILRPGRFGSGT